MLNMTNNKSVNPELSSRCHPVGHLVIRWRWLVKHRKQSFEQTGFPSGTGKQAEQMPQPGFLSKLSVCADSFLISHGMFRSLGFTLCKTKKFPQWMCFLFKVQFRRGPSQKENIIFAIVIVESICSKSYLFLWMYVQLYHFAVKL